MPKLNPYLIENIGQSLLALDDVAKGWLAKYNDCTRNTIAILNTITIIPFIIWLYDLVELVVKVNKITLQNFRYHIKLATALISLKENPDPQVFLYKNELLF